MIKLLDTSYLKLCFIFMTHVLFLRALLYLLINTRHHIHLYSNIYPHLQSSETSV